MNKHVILSLCLILFSTLALPVKANNCYTTSFGTVICPGGGGGAPPDATSVPEPSTLVLFGIGVIGLAASKKYHSKRNHKE